MDLPMMFCMRASMGVTTGVVSMVLPTAMRSKAVNVSELMICLSNRTFAKMIMINALVCNSQPMREASPFCQFKIFPAH